MKTNRIKSSLAAGFSLVEMLVVIAIIGVIAAIAVPQISNFTDNANTGKNKRNAQNLASVFSAAQAAGKDFIGSDVATTISNVVAGGTVTTGSFAGEFFGVPNMSSTDQSAAAPYLSVADGVLKYNASN